MLTQRIALGGGKCPEWLPRSLYDRYGGTDIRSSGTAGEARWRRQKTTLADLEDFALSDLVVANSPSVTLELTTSRSRS